MGGDRQSTWEHMAPTNNKPCALHTETSGGQPGHTSRTVTQTMTVRLETVRPCWSRECSPSSPPDTPSLYPPEDQDYTNQKYTLKKCWAKYNPALGKIWTNPAIGLFSTNNFDNWVKKPKQSLGLSIFYPALGCI